MRPGTGTAPSGRRPPRTPASAAGGTGGQAGRRGVNGALATLAKKVLEPDDALDDSCLVAGLLESYKTDKQSSRTGGLASLPLPPSYSSHPVTAYTPRLTSLVRSIVRLHNDDPNAAQVRLLNLLFRSVGGTGDTDLDPEECRVEEMDQDDWQSVVTDLVEEMRHTPLDRVLLCSDPDGAVHAASVLERKDSEREGGGGEVGTRMGTGEAGEVVKVTPASLGVREYRRIYEEFWYLLGGVALAEGGMANNLDAGANEEDEIEDSSSSEEEEEEEEKDEEEESDGEEEEQGAGKKSPGSSGGGGNKKTPTKKKKKKKTPSSKKRSSYSSSKKRKKIAKTKARKAEFTTTVRFDAELVKDLLGRVTELISVGQPDIRSAAVVAAYQMGKAVLDRTVLLGNKIGVAERQYAAAANNTSASAAGGGSASKKSKRSPGKAALSSKAESLRYQIDSLKRTRADLEQVVLEAVVQGVFVHRYRDSDPHIRALSVRSLSVMTVVRPDLFLMDRYLKYFGWLLSDKAPIVREASLEGLMAPFGMVHGKRTLPEYEAAGRINLGLLGRVAAKFLPRIADCVIDVNSSVQERAVRLLLAFLRDGERGDPNPL